MADHNNPQSRDEEILIATIDRTEYNKLPQSRMEELLLELKETIEEGGGGTTNYNNLSNQPQVNGETLIGDKSGSDLGLVDAEEGKCLSTNDYDDKEKAAVAAATLAIAAMKDGSELDSFGDVEVALLDKADVSDLGTAAAKDSTNSVTSGSTDLVESGAVKDAIDAAVAAAYHHAGTKTVAQLTHDLLIAANEGNVYNITDSGTTTSDFIEGIGKTIDEGSNVGICKVGNVYMFDLLSGFVDTTNFVQKSQTAGLLNNDGTVNTTIEDDIDSLKSGLTTLDTEVNGDATVYPYADVITISDAVPANVADCNVKIEPVQDLHGQSAPYVGGAGKNKLPLVLADIKTANTTGTWSGNAYTVNDVTFTILTDNDGNIIGIKTSGTSSGYIYFNVATVSFESGVVINGAPAGGGEYKWFQAIDSTSDYDTGSGTTLSVSVTNKKFMIVVANGVDMSNKTFYPMIRLSTETDASYAPYTNICPITGHTEASVQRDGKNLLNLNSSNTTILKRSGSVSIINANTLSLSAMTNAANVVNVVVPCFRNTDYVVRFTGTNINAYGIKFYEEIPADWQNLFSGNLSGNSGNNKYILLCFRATESMAMTVSDIQIEFGQVSSEFVPYQGKTYTIALGDTIYGGTVRIDSNGNTVMDVDRAVVDMGTLEWIKDSSVGHSRYVANNSGMKTNGSVISDVFQSAAYDQVYSHTKDNAISIHNTYSQFAVHSTYYENDYDATQFGNAMSGHYACYELATPFTVQLTPTQIQLLKGTNTITASTGQISVTVNGVSGAIGSLQTQANTTDEALAELAADIAEQLPTAPTTDGSYVLTVTVADGTPTYSWESAT